MCITVSGRRSEGMKPSFFNYFVSSLLLYNHLTTYSYIEDTSQVARTNGNIGPLVIDIGIDRGVPSWPVVKYETRHASPLDARWVGQMLSDGANSFMFDRQNIRRDRDIDT